MFGAAGLVHVALFVFVAVVAAFRYGRTRRTTAAAPAVPAAGGERMLGLGAVGRVGPSMSSFSRRAALPYRRPPHRT
ncbi:hypothetical protein ABZ354_06265 [Streptomyces sp. NPDC005925]|uniref:hypothetical protein n=1 Tax=Streptomyces sp. NPDC005925 TaxID=3157172 RepID=UPI0033C37617